MDYESYMRRALALAAEAAAAGEVPVGCVIVDASGAVLGEGRNRREETRSVLGHAELEALDAGLGRLVYGAREAQYGSVNSILNLFEERYPSKTAIFGGVLAEESAALLRAFFEGKRK